MQSMREQCLWTMRGFFGFFGNIRLAGGVYVIMLVKTFQDDRKPESSCH